MKQTATEKLEKLMSDSRISTSFENLIARYVKHQRTYRKDERILEYAYTIHEFLIYHDKEPESATSETLQDYLKHKAEKKGSITGSRVMDIHHKSLNAYRYKIISFYRWMSKHTKLKIDKELAYPTPKLVIKQRMPMEKLCEKRVQAILNNEISLSNRKDDRALSQEELKQKYSHLLLDEANLKILNDFHNYKLASGKVESYIGFISKIAFLKRLGLHLKAKNKTYRDATREDIQDFISEVQKGIKDNGENNGTEA